MREQEPKSWIQIWAPPLALLAVALIGLYETGVLADVPPSLQPANWHEVVPKNLCAPGEGAGPRAAGTIFRGARPGAEGLEYLQSQGFKSVMDLEVPEENLAEADIVKQLGLGIRELEHPMNDGMGVNQLPDFGGDDNDSIIAAVAELRRPENFPIYVHCTYGQDRTGMTVALHRVFDECWTPKDAEDEWNHIEGWLHYTFQIPKHIYFHKVMDDPELHQYFKDQLQKLAQAAPSQGSVDTESAGLQMPVAQVQGVSEPGRSMKEPGGVTGNP